MTICILRDYKGIGNILPFFCEKPYRHYKQNEDDFLSIVIQSEQEKIRVFVLLAEEQIRCNNGSIKTDCESIMNDRLTFDDGTLFTSHFRKNLRLGKG